METYPKSQRNTVKRIPKRGHYDKKTLFEILDNGFFCHVSFVIDGQPFIIPTAYGREGERIFIHGATSSRMIGALEKGIQVCLAVTHIDGIVMARSVFHHSMNYRSSVIFGTATIVREEEKVQALEVITQNICRGRWQEARLPNNTELKATQVLAIQIEEASSKIRTGMPVDDTEDYSLDVWAGVVPVQSVYGQPVADPDLKKRLPIPDSVHNLLDLNKSRGSGNGISST